MIVRRLARPLLASVFVTGGADAFRNPAPRAKVAAPLLDKLSTKAQPVAQKAAAATADAVDASAEKVHEVAGKVADAAEHAPDRATDATQDAADAVTGAADDVRSEVHHVAAGGPLPFENETYVKVNGAVQVGAGALLALGWFPRLASTALAASLVPTTLAGHRFWEYEGAERKAQQIHFVKNTALLGGLILAAVDTEGRPGVAWRARRLGQDTKVAAEAAKANAAIGRRAVKANAKAAARLAAANAADAGAVSRRQVRAAAEQARSEALARGAEARKQARSLRKQAARRASEIGDALGEAADAAADELLPRLHDAAARVQAAAR